MRFKIMAECVVCGQVSECLCQRETASGTWSITFDEASARKRVAELEAIGVKAHYEEAPMGTMWFDNNDGWFD